MLNMNVKRMALAMLLLPLVTDAQIKKPDIFVESSAFVSGGKNAPFWMLSNQFGKYSNHGYNVNYSLGIQSGFDSTKNIDFAYGFELMNRIDTGYHIYPHELYLALKLWFFDIHVGWREEVFGNAYPGLTSGNMLWSGNARPMPKISIRVPEFTPVPFTQGYVEFKGNLAHGWFEQDRYTTDLLLHHKSFIGRVGGKLPVNFHYGLHHFAQWGGHSQVTGYENMPSDFEAFIWVFKVSEGAPGDSLGGETINRYGNHIGSRNLGLDVKMPQWKTGIYWQTIFEDTSGKAWRNIRDGLWGIYWENQKENPLIKAVVVEYLNTTDQSGPSHDPIDSLGIRGGGADNYFRHYIYQNGWSRYDMTLGTPMITSEIFDAGTALSTTNSRVKAYHLGINGNINLWHAYALKITYSENFGNYTWPYDHFHPTTFEPSKKSLSCGLTYHVGFRKAKGSLKFSAAADFGAMYGDNVGIQVGYRREF
jgi:hypothetical protein